MNLTRAQADFVKRAEDKLLSAGSQLNSAGVNLLRQLKDINDHRDSDAEAYLAIYGDKTSSDKYEGEVKKINATIDAIYNSGLTNQTREEAEAQVNPNQPPPG